MLDFVRKLFRRRAEPRSIEVPENTFIQCPECKATLYQKNLDQNHGVCPDCGHTMPLNVAQWLQLLTDEGSFAELFRGIRPVDALKFPKYGKRLEQLAVECPSEAIVTGSCTIGGRPALLGVMDSSFLMASMGSVVGEKISLLVERGASKRLPVVLVVRSGGARMQEGALSLMQMAKTSAALRKLTEARQLFIPILCHPTTGGVSASFAMLGDISIAEPGALIAFAGPRVIEQTIRQKLPEGFQKAEFVLEKGFVDLIVPRAEMRASLTRLLEFHA
jgi:acetyl-CoA carboxylase carboxyl transferase subunit beta